MEKYCEKCGRHIGDDDFLCPYCGAIWGDRMTKPALADQKEAPPPEVEVPPAAAQEAQPETQAQKQQPRWVLPVAVAGLALIFLLVLLVSERNLGAGEGTTAPGTLGSSTTLNSYEATTTYTVTFVDPFGNPIEGVGIYNLRNDLWSSVIPPKYTYSDSNGKASFTLYDAFYMKPYVHIYSVPEGYDSKMMDSIVWYPEGQTHMQLVLIPLPDGGDETLPPTTEPIVTIDPVVPPYQLIVYEEYTVRVVDEEGDPVPGVGIRNGYIAVSSIQPQSAVTDENGQAVLRMQTAFAAVRITSVPEGYSTSLVNVKHKFQEGQTFMKLVLERDSGTGVDIPLPGNSYSVTIENTDWLYEPLVENAEPGSILRVKLHYRADYTVMLFANGVEIDNFELNGDYNEVYHVEYYVTMPAQPLQLRVRAYPFGKDDDAAKELFRIYYRKNPDAPDAQCVYDYGSYGAEGEFLVALLQLDTKRMPQPVFEDVAGEKFAYYTSDRIQVYAYGELLSLETAHRRGYLTAVDIHEIQRLHTAYMSDENIKTEEDNLQY